MRGRRSLSRRIVGHVLRVSLIGALMLYETYRIHHHRKAHL